MAAPDLKELLGLDVETRLALVQELWDSIVNEAQTGATLPLSDDERDLVAERLREDHDDPASAIPWAEARSRLRPGR